jgi:hypothetical protein
MELFGTDFNDRQTSEGDILWVNRMASEIVAHLPRMQREYPDREAFWSWFCGEVESMLRYVATDEDRLYAKERLNALLEEAGIADRFELTALAIDLTFVEHFPSRN